MIAIRGATTVNSNTVDEIKNSSIELFDEIISRNNIKLDDIKVVIFSCTKDITKDYPGKFIREHFKLSNIAIMHFNEMHVEGSLQKCIRVLVLLECCSESKNIEYIYLKEAKNLRKDLINIT